MTAAERFTVRAYHGALFVFDRHTGANATAEGYRLRDPTSQRAAIRFMHRLEQQHQEGTYDRLESPRRVDAGKD